MLLFVGAAIFFSSVCRFHRCHNWKFVFELTNRASDRKKEYGIFPSFNECDLLFLCCDRNFIKKKRFFVQTVDINEFRAYCKLAKINYILKFFFDFYSYCVRFNIKINHLSELRKDCVWKISIIIKIIREGGSRSLICVFVVRLEFVCAWSKIDALEFIKFVASSYKRDQCFLSFGVCVCVLFLIRASWSLDHHQLSATVVLHRNCVRWSSKQVYMCVQETEIALSSIS